MMVLSNHATRDTSALRRAGADAKFDKSTEIIALMTPVRPSAPSASPG